MTDPILITGAPRSGTSLVAGLVHLCGAFGGRREQLVRARLTNRKGNFENLQVRNRLIKPFLRQLGADPRAQRSLPDIGRVKEAAIEMGPSWRMRVEEVLLDEGYSEGPWFVKEPKIASHWPVWHAAFPGARWVIVRRRDEDVVESCRRTAFMNAHQDDEGWRLWLAAYKERLEEIRSVVAYSRQIWPELLIEGKTEDAKSLVRWLGLPWREDEARRFVSPELWRQGLETSGRSSGRTAPLPRSN